MNTVDELKKSAAEHAVELIESGMVIGLGTGSTAYYATVKIGALIRTGNLKNIKAIASSKASEELARSLDIPLTDFKNNPCINVTIDGADEVDNDLNLIKGGGGALLREKVLAQASEKFYAVVDGSKLSAKLGEKWKVPVEVIPFALDSELFFLNNYSENISVRKNNNGEAFITDEGNYIIDVDFGPLDDVYSTSAMLNERAGIVEHGLFIDIADKVFAAKENEVLILDKLKK